MLVATAAFGFFGCSDDTEEDENLVVEFTVSGSDSDSSRNVTMKAPDEYSDKDIKIVYTLDGTQPDITFDKMSYAAATDKTKIAEFVDYGTASLYESAVAISTTTTINARAFYVDAANDKCVMGSEWSVKTVNVTDTSSKATASTATGASQGNFEFTLASTGNSNTVHYFDTSASNVFKLNDNYPNAYYQIQFSWKGKGKGNWYLYMRDVNNGLIKNSDGSTSFLAKGTYTGDCFNAADGSVANGDLTLTNSDSTTGSVTITDNTKFTLYVNNSGAATDANATDTLGTFTVSDAK
jgi:hypothetical protein